MVVAGYYGFGNAGDELILYSLIRGFRAENPDVAITVLSHEPRETALRFDVRSVSRWKPHAWVPALLRAERFILGGGGLLQESTGPWNHLYYLSLVLCAKLAGCRTEIVALGVDPIRSSLNRFWTRFVVDHAVDVLSVRDEASREALRNAGVRLPLAIQSDPVFELRVDSLSVKGTGIAFALTPWKDRPQWAREVAVLFGHLRNDLHVPIDLLVFFPEEDEPFAREVAALAPSVQTVRMCENPLDLLSWVPRYGLVVANRFHALVLADISGVPFAGWGDQLKIRSLCGKMNSPYWNYSEGWNARSQFMAITRLYQRWNKSVILEPRIG